MSAATAPTETGGESATAGRLFRAAALGSVLVLTASYVSVLRSVALVVGGSSGVVPVAVGALLATTAVAALVSERTAISAAVALAVLGNLWYLRTTPATVGVVLDAWGLLVSDAVALLTGLSLIQLTNAEAWAVGSVPAPVFLSWYLAVRRRYALAAAIGGGTLLAFVLTGDAGTVVTLAGVLGAAGAVGFGDLERRGAGIDQADALAVTFAAMAVLSLTVTVVPAGGGSPLSLHGTSGVGGQQGDTVESGVVSSSGELQLRGSVELSPEVRFTVESDEPGYWRTGVYDKFTGDSWYRSGGTRAWNDQTTPPPGGSEPVDQIYEVESATSAMPSMYKPTELSDDVAGRTQLTRHSSLRYQGSFQPGDSYRVVSHRSDAPPAELRRAGTDYPERIRDEFLQLPSDQPDRVGELTREVTADADTPYDKAVAVENYLESEKSYSLNVERPEGNVADAFLFEMDAGYCTYYATTMTAMLREEGIPARMAVGYSTGQPVDEDRYVVRGLNAHAWVEVYFPEVGWVTFDPTPSSERRQTRENRVRTARSSGNEDADTDESRDREPIQYDDEEDSSPTRNRIQDNDTTPDNETDTALDNRTNATERTPDRFDETNESDDDDESGLLARLPPYEAIGIGLIALFGLALLARRAGHARRLRRAAGLRWQGRGRSPGEDAERAFERLELLLSRDGRPRAPAETPREYVNRVAADRDDDRIDRVRRIYERTRYGGEVSADEAAEAIELVDDLIAEESRFPALN